MKIGKRTDTAALGASFNSAAFGVEHLEGYSICASWTETTPGNDTFNSGAVEVQTLTFDTKANTTHQDFIVVEDTIGTKYAVALTKPVAEIQTLTFPTKAAAANGDYVVVEDTIGVKYAVALTKPVAEVQTLTYPTKAGAADGDFIIVEDTVGVKYALYLDTTGGGAVVPAGALYSAATYKAGVNISAATDEASVAAACETAWNLLTGFTTAITSNDTAANGTMTFTQTIKAPVVDPVPKNFDESTAGTILGVETTAGVTAQTPSGAAWTAATYKGLADISGDTSAADVAVSAEVALNLLTGFTAAVTSDDTANDGTMLLTQVIKAPTVDPIPKDYNDAGAGSIAGVETTAGVASTAPSGPIWTAATYKGLADISSDTTAANVAARAETALNALTGLTAAITTNDGAANGTMTLTQILFGPTVNPIPKNAAEAGAGSIAGVETTAGVDSNVNLTDDELTLGAHGFYTGLKIRFTTTGTLPTGISPATDYFAILIDTDIIQIATSYANAIAGTEIDITGEGTGAHTAVVQDALAGTFKLQACNNPFTNNVNMTADPLATWVDVTGSSIAVTAAGSQFWNVSDAYYSAFRLVWTSTTGIGTVTSHILAKGDQ